MKRFFCAFVLLLVIVITGCDLQPKIASIPDSIGDFISERYPTLLAEPDSEIYQTAVADYGVYASPEVYGNGDTSDQDYVLYSPVDDYMMPNQDAGAADIDDETADTEDEYVDDTNDAEEEEDDSYAPDTDVDDLMIPDYVNEKPIEPKAKPKVVQDEKTDLIRAPVREITIEKGDTLYSVSRKYSVPVNDLAVMNKISAPFTLSIGQKLKVPDMLSVPKYDAGEKVKRTENKKEAPQNTAKVAQTKPEVKKASPKADDKKVDKTAVKKTETKKAEAKSAKSATVSKAPAATKTPTAKAKDTKVKKTETKKTEKTSAKKTDAKKTATKKDTKKTAAKKTEQKKSNVKKTDNKKIATQKKQQTKRTAEKMVARSSSKFSWPVRGKILSGYGSKSNGLFNDGINIQSSRGTAVVAAENGFVAYAGNEVKGMGNLVIIQHADGWMTVYAHMDSMAVRRGHKVSVGQKIGTVGTSGKVDQPQLHFEIRKGTKAYNPINYLKK